MASNERKLSARSFEARRHGVGNASTRVSNSLVIATFLLVFISTTIAVAHSRGMVPDSDLVNAFSSVNPTWNASENDNGSASACLGASNCDPYLGAPPTSVLGSSANTVEPDDSGGWNGPTYWYESYYKLNSTHYHPKEVWTSIQVPSSGTVDGDQYTLTINVFDNLNYFDQIGLSSDYGCSGCGNPYNTWTVGWEQGTYANGDCGGGGLYSRDGAESGGIVPNSWYTFAMTLGGGSLNYEVFQGQNTVSGTPVWTNSVSDSATYFLVQHLVNDCYGGGAGTGFFGLSFFEEVNYIASHDPAQGVPRWDFEFSDTTVDVNGTESKLPNSDFNPQDTGRSYPPDPHGYFMDYTAGTYTIRVANEADSLSFSQDLFVISPGQSFSITGDDLAVGASSPTDYCIVNGCSATPSYCLWPSGWLGSCGFSPDSVPSSVSYSATAPSNATSGEYYGIIVYEVPISSYTETTTWVWYIDVT